MHSSFWKNDTFLELSEGFLMCNTLKYCSSIPHSFLRIDYKGHIKIVFYSWNFLSLPFNYGWVFDLLKQPTNNLLSHTCHPSREMLHAYLSWGKAQIPQGPPPTEESLKENLRAAVLTRLLAELPGCVSGCRKMLQLAYCDRALIFSLWWITLGSHSWGCAGLGCTLQTCSRKESALTNEENSKKKTRSGSSLIVNGVT